MIRSALRLLSCLALGAVAPAAGAQTLSDIAEVVQVEVLPGWREADGRHVAGLSVRLAPGWKTYWRSAGSLGISPRIDWAGSRNLVAAQPVWPMPAVFREADGLSVGYDADFVLPVVVRPADPSAPIRLRASLDIGVCEAICVPAHLELDAQLPGEGASDPAIVAALRDRPERVRTAADCRIEPIENGVRLTAEIRMRPLGPGEAVMFELPDPSLWIGDAQVARQGDRLVATSEVYAQGGGLGLARGDVRITAFADGAGVELSGCRG